MTMTVIFLSASSKIRSRTKLTLKKSLRKSLN